MKLLRIRPGARPLALGRPVVTLGNFDGLHRGHRRIVREAVRRARAARVAAVAVTFDPHPVEVLRPSPSFCRLRTLEQRAADLAEHGIDATVVLAFDRDLATMTPRSFAEDVLGRMLHASFVLVGDGFCFGRDRSGTVEGLAALGRELGFRAHAVPPVVVGGEPVSSTRVRSALAAGDVREAARLLGRPYRLEGRVVKGMGRGKPLVLPTANLEPTGQCLPAPGVYATVVVVRGRRVRGATFVGAPVTFGDLRPVVESHLVGWSGASLVGETIAVELRTRLRGQERFASPEALRAQVERDVREVRRAIRASSLAER